MPTTNGASTELSEAQRDQLMQSGKLLHALAADPRYRPRVLELVHEVLPDQAFPELDLRKELREELKDSIAKTVEPVAKASETVATRLSNIEKLVARSAFASTHGLAEDELVEVEELATKSKIADGDTAVELWRARQTLGQPRATAKPSPVTEERRKLLRTNPMQFAMEVGREVQADIRRGRRSA